MPYAFAIIINETSNSAVVKVRSDNGKTSQDGYTVEEGEGFDNNLLEQIMLDPDFGDSGYTYHLCRIAATATKP